MESVGYEMIRLQFQRKIKISESHLAILLDNII